MGPNIFSRICVLLALLSPLGITSCTPKEISLSKEQSVNEPCSSCVRFSLNTWRFTPSQGSNAEELLRVPEGAGIPSLSVGPLRVISANNVKAILALLNKDKRFQQIMSTTDDTALMESLTISVVNSSEELNAVLTPGPKLKRPSSRFINFKLSSSDPRGDNAGRVQVVTPGRIMLPDGGALLVIHHMDETSVIWLIQASY